MTTVQIVGIGIAATIVVALVVSLYVTRRKDRDIAAERLKAPPVTADTASFLDEPPRDELELFGARHREAVVSFRPDTDSPPPPSQPASTEADLAPAGAEAVKAEVPPAKAEAPVAEAVEAEVPPVEIEATEVPPVEVEATAAPSVDGDASHLVRLSDIIVTTNEQRVDLSDPDVRTMLKDLVKYEIDLATHYREIGQNVDAVLQLTEAERVCTALGMTSHARLIKEMILALQS